MGGYILYLWVGLNTTDSLQNILSLETATSVCSVSLLRSDGQVYERNINDGNRHSKIITILIEQLLSEADIRLVDLDAIAVSNGPGSYTGLRVGFSVAKAMCFALDIPMLCIDTLEALAYAYQKEDCLVAPMIDARRMEVYYALWGGDHKLIRPTQALIVEQDSLNDIISDRAQLILCGDGAAKVYEKINNPEIILAGQESLAKYLLPLAQVAFKKEQFADIAYAVPFYFKSPLITKSKKKFY